MGISEKQIKGARELLRQYNMFLESKLFKKEALDKALVEFMVEVTNSAKRVEYIKAVNAVRTASRQSAYRRRW